LVGWRLLSLFRHVWTRYATKGGQHWALNAFSLPPTFVLYSTAVLNAGSFYLCSCETERTKNSLARDADTFGGPFVALSLRRRDVYPWRMAGAPATATARALAIAALQLCPITDDIVPCTYRFPPRAGDVGRQRCTSPQFNASWRSVLVPPPDLAHARCAWDARRFVPTHPRPHTALNYFHFISVRHKFITGLWRPVFLPRSYPHMAGSSATLPHHLHYHLPAATLPAPVLDAHSTIVVRSTGCLDGGRTRGTKPPTCHATPAPSPRYGSMLQYPHFHHLPRIPTATAS